MTGFLRQATVNPDTLLLKTLFTICFRHAWFWVIAILPLTFWLSSFVPRTVIEVSNESLMEKDSELHAVMERVRADFGSDRIVAIHADSPELFSPRKLEILAGIHGELSKLRQVQRVDSLFSIQHLTRTPDGLSIGPLLNPRHIPHDHGVLTDKKASALQNPLIAGRLLSKDGRATLFSLFLETPPGDESITGGRDTRQVYRDIENILSRHRSEFNELYQIGMPAVQKTMEELIIEDQKLLLPLAAIILVLLIGSMLRSFMAAVIPLLNTLIAIIWILAAMVWLDIPVNILNSIIPAILLIIGATEDVHFLAEYRRALDRGLKGESAVRHVGEKIGVTLLLTGITTSIGFSATGIADLRILREFGITAGLAIALRMILTLTFLPALIGLNARFSKPEVKPSPLPEIKKREAGWLYTRLVLDHLLLHPKAIIGLLLLIASIGLYYGTKVEVGNDLIEFLDPQSTLVRQIEQTGERLTGTKALFLTLYGEEGEFKSPDSLRKIARIQERLENAGGISSTVSIADFIALIHREFSESEKAGFAIPENPELVAQYLLLIDPEALQPYSTEDYSKANIIVLTNLHDSREFSALYRQINYRLRSGEFGPLDFTLSGQSILVSEAVDEIVKGQILSLMVVIGILFLIVGFLFVSWKASLLAVLSNLFPIALLFGTMGLLAIPLNVGTCMVAAITVGIAVDDTLHLMVRYNRELKRTKNERSALEASLHSEFLPVVTTSIALASGFSVLMFSNFIPLRQFAGLSAMVISVALVADLLLTPLLLSTTRLITVWDILGLRLRKTLLQRSPLFQGMRPWQAKRLILSSNLEEYEEGEYLVRQDEMGDTMYVIIDGNLEVRRGPENQKTVLAKLTVGDAFGEIALVSRSKRTADVVATGPAKVLALDWDSLTSLQRFAPYLSSRLFLNLADIMGKRMISSLGKLDTAAPFLMEMNKEENRENGNG